MGFTTIDSSSTDALPFWVSKAEWSLEAGQSATAESFFDFEILVSSQCGPDSSEFEELIQCLVMLRRIRAVEYDWKDLKRNA